MDKFVQYWDHISSADRIIILMGGMIVFWVAEGYYPLFRFSYRRYKHAGFNLIFLATTIVLNLLFGLVTIRMCQYVTVHRIGLLNVYALPIWATLIIGLFAGDLFGQFIPHYIMHKIKWMWKFHMIHHSDTHVDVTTGTRHHPGEWLFRETFMIVGVVVMGIPVWLYFLYRSVAALFTHFNHANIRVQEWIDKPISWIFVSPNMHKIHHHYKRPFTDCNYSNIFSLWDRLFGTFQYTDPKTIRYGLDVLDDSTDENIGYQFKIPFDKSIKTDY
jgi:sterol desaturase/sphingolipid hydroxylase (fatty acid hydroxylase superfamily)